MASAAQVSANRENAKRPRVLSEDTKQSLRARALKHGLASKLDANTVIKGENKQEFETIRDALLSDATLGTAQEILLIKMQAESYWKFQRAGRMETGAMDISLVAAEIQESIPHDLKDENLGAALAMALRGESTWFDKLRRYSATAERTFFRATRELAMIRKAGPQEPISQPEIAEPEVNQPEISQAEIGQPEIGPLDIGYVPQTTEPAPNPEPAPTKIGYVPQSGQSLDAIISPDLLIQLEAMSTAEAFDFLDKLTAPPA